MGLEHFFDEDLCTDYLLLKGGTVLHKLNGENFTVVTDNEGVKYLQFLWSLDGADPDDPDLVSEYQRKHPLRMTVRADEVIGIGQQFWEECTG